MSDTLIKTSGQPAVIDPSTGGAGTWAASLVAGTPTGPRSPALSAGQAFVDELPSGGWRCTTKPGAVGVAGPLTFFACGNGAAGQFGGTFGVQSGATVGGGGAGTMLLGSSSPTVGASYTVNAGSGGGNPGVASGTIRFGTSSPGAGGAQGDWAVTGPGAMLGVQARATMPANVNATQGGYWGLISGPSSVPMYRDNLGADRQLQYRQEQAYQAVATAATVAVTNADLLFHSTPGAAFADSAASTAFTVGADCVATYAGALTKRFLVRVVVATHALVGGGFANWTGCVALNGDVLGTAGGSQRLNGECNVNDTGAALDDSEQRGVFERIVTLATGDTVQPAIARFVGTAAVDLDVTWLTMTIAEVN